MTSATGTGPTGTGPTGTGPTSTGPEAALRVERVSKIFPGTRALREVSLEVRRGHVHALVGGNGSGKSTLVGILAGVLHGDPGGTLTVGGHRVASERTSPAWARAAGLHVVHQHPAVFPDLSVAENIAIGRGFPTGPAGSIRRGCLRRRTQALLERFDVHARPDTPVAALRPADRTMVAIARALQDQEGLHEGVLVLDEPTAALPHADVDLLLAALRRYADAGQAILLVSHRLDEVVRAADRATVLRDGAVAGTLEAAALSEDRLVELIVGRALEQVFPEMPPVRGDEVALAVRGLAGGPLREVGFALRRGEVLGVAGLLGSGRTELLKMIFGAYPVRSGEIRLDGESVRFDGVGAAVRAGVAYVPEDRGEAAFLPMSVRENVSAAQVGAYWRRLRLRHRQEAADARRCLEDFLIRASSDRAPMSTLSGGNQQKVVLARWLRRRPRVLLLDEPTQGVDVAARAEIYALVRAAVAAGTSVLLVTDDFEELSRVSDRVVVLARGRVVAEVRPPHLGAARLTELAFAGQEAAS